MLLEISLALLCVAFALWLARHRIAALRSQREERQRRALAHQIDWNRPARRSRQRRPGWQFWR